MFVLVRHFLSVDMLKLILAIAGSEISYVGPYKHTVGSYEMSVGSTWPLDFKVDS
jgi:hypothetical protein